MEPISFRLLAPRAGIPQDSIFLRIRESAEVPLLQSFYPNLPQAKVSLTSGEGESNWLSTETQTKSFSHSVVKSVYEERNCFASQV
ncbi:unnamed protein product [Protopolystoma xenopodis]|uniref:Uncharacterized protein n=1 Tax=Protopolystoma xenopodis TaxID=117903 RepID=A0A3S5CNH4_9PLAT|nr:unnamed protein product [Protopolystoma xenopodis]